MKTVNVSKNLYGNYMRKAQECLDAARDASAKQNNNAAVINAIHCGISASDALLVFFKGIRSSGQNHNETISLLRTLDFNKEEMNNKTRQLQHLLQIKNAAEYEERLMTSGDSENAVRDSERFYSWVKEKLAMM